MPTGPALIRPSPEPGARASVRAVVVHDDAMLARIASTVGLQPVASFRYDVDPTCTRATVQLEVAGSTWQVARVQHLLRRVVGVLDVRETGGGSAGRDG
jgi:hypothetical protein